MKDKWWARRMITKETTNNITKIVFMLGIVFFVAMTGTWILPQLREGGMVRPVYAWSIVIVNSGIIIIMLKDIFKQAKKQ